jgi:hypothetical protein
VTSQLLVVLLAAAQMVEAGRPRPDQELDKGTSVIAGHIIDVTTKQAIADAKVHLITNTAVRKTIHGVTDKDGRFEFVDLPAGRYLFRIERTDYFLVAPDGTPAATGQPALINVSEGERLERVTFRMRRGSSIRGVITDDAGRPLAAARVFARMADQPLWYRQVETDKRGEYSITGLPNGQFTIEAMGPQLPGSAIPPLPGSEILGSSPHYERTFYPGVAAAADATPISVVPGDELRDVNIIVRLLAPSGVFGRIITPTAHVLDSLEVVAESSPARSRHTVASREVKDGRFSFTSLKPGRYVVWVRGVLGGDLHASAVAVHVADVASDVELMLAPTGMIEGRVVTDNGHPLPSDAIRIVALLADGETAVQLASPDQADLFADGTFRLEGLFGDRILRLNGLPPEWTIKKVMNGRREVAPPHVSITPGVTTINIQIVIGFP